MRNVLFSSSSMRYNGGAIMCLLEIIKYSNENIHPIVVLSGHGTTEDELKRRNIEYYVVRSYDWLVQREKKKSVTGKAKWLIQKLVNIKAEIQLFHILRKHKIDVLHINSVYNPAGVAAARRMHIPVVWHIREFSEGAPETPSYWNARKSYRVMSQSDCMIGVSKCICEWYQQKMPDAKIQLVYDGVDTEQIHPVLHPLFEKKPYRLLLSGGITPVKGYTDAIKALGILKVKRPELSLELHIAGRKMNLAYYESLVKLAAEEGVTERVVFHDFVHDMNSLLEETDILLVCSRSESFGRACVEGMLKGCVVIGANNTGTSEILQQNKYGYLYTTGDAEDLANRIIQITDKPDSHVALTKSSMKYAEAEYSAKRNAELVSNILLNIR